MHNQEIFVHFAEAELVYVGHASVIAQAEGIRCETTPQYALELQFHNTWKLLLQASD